MLQKLDQSGFSIMEIIVASVIFPIIVFGLYNATQAVNRSYSIARQYNEIYAVLSACPELDRALEFNSITEDNNCFPNNVFEVEGGSSGTITYEPNVAIQQTEELGATEELSDIDDAKIISINVAIPNTSAPPVELRLLVARNGLGQQ
jgi:prepilin-type N-terminal cleavage/methylation domain-containing protein